MLQHPSLWTELDLSNWQNPAPVFEVLKGTERAREALRRVNLEFTVGIDDGHLETLSHFPLVAVNLNGCQKCAAWLASQTLNSSFILVKIDRDRDLSNGQPCSIHST